MKKAFYAHELPNKTVEGIRNSQLTTLQRSGGVEFFDVSFGSAMLNTSMNTTKIYLCEVCNEEATWSHQKANKYCSQTCSAIGRFEITSVAKFNEGKLKDRGTIRKVLSLLHGYECDVCSISEWNNEPLTLQVDHINGLANDNSPENLRLICANCHSQTTSYCGRNVGNGRQALGLSRSD